VIPEESQDRRPGPFFNPALFQPAPFPQPYARKWLSPGGRGSYQPSLSGCEGWVNSVTYEAPEVAAGVPRAQAQT